MRTALYERHQALGAKMVDFNGWEMPIQYKGIIAEHHAVRNAVGMFDVSHMGRIVIEGEDAEPFLDFLSTNKIAGKPDCSATYTVWPNAQGGSVDDVIIYKKDSRHFFVIVNAGNRQKDLEHLVSHRKDYRVIIADKFKDEGILAIQGPKALDTFAKIIPEVKNLKPMHFQVHGDVILSGTGYTGSGGLEVYAPHDKIVNFWDQLIKLGVEPIGLGARDTLRLEMGYALYGHELSDTISPKESVSAWTVKNKEYLGKESVEKKSKRHAYGIILADKGIAREGYPVLKDGRPIGIVTSGTLSPTLNKAIAIVLVEGNCPIGDSVDIQIRQNLVKAHIVELPFLKKDNT